jgi:hypothetical protein
VILQLQTDSFAKTMDTSDPFDVGGREGTRCEWIRFDLINNNNNNNNNVFPVHAIKACRGNRVKPGTHYPHVTFAHVMLRVQLGYLTLNAHTSVTLLTSRDLT